MEWYDFGAAEVEAGMPERQQRTLAFTTNRAAAFDGVHLHLRALLDADTALDARAQRTTWSCLYVRLLPTAEAVWLPAGSAIACRCAVDVAGECAHYAIEVEAAVPGEPLRSVASFAWSGDG